MYDIYLTRLFKNLGIHIFTVIFVSLNNYWNALSKQCYIKNIFSTLSVCNKLFLFTVCVVFIFVMIEEVQVGPVGLFVLRRLM